MRRLRVREKSPGLKILWIWTIGTAAILITSVVRTRMRDMETLINSQQEQHRQPTPADSASATILDTFPQSDQVMPVPEDN
ncbi:Basic leucine zipper/W2 domain protein [Quillaja saponaria]|uniref:Basic leucine zipper/W2 domain protein n=1 Tax=Quillaja saponaria TaxID=32244 RepID=A0AAD7Q2G3_QUISA|nr:Basic leucine zipper/W2 domain protein [Quillaja saponaria]